MQQRLAPKARTLLLPERTGGPISPSTGAAMTRPLMAKLVLWLDTVAMFLVLACCLFFAFAHDRLAADVSAKVSTAREQLAAPLAATPSGSSCGIPNSERDAFNAGWEVGNAASK